MHILFNISQVKYNQTMKFGQLLEYNKWNIFLWKTCSKWDMLTSSRPLSVLEKALYKQVVCRLVSVYFDSPQISMQWKQTA